MSPPLIGSRISLISKKEIRYEGILYDINKKDATIALKDVKSFGTEDRKVPQLVPAVDKVYEFIKFRGSDIRDLHVHEPPQGAETPPPPGIGQPPKAAQATPQRPQTSQRPPQAQPQAPPARQQQQKAAAPTPVWNRGPPPSSGSAQPQNRPGPAPGARRGQPNAMPGTGQELLRRRERGLASGSAEDISQDFDFESANSAFDKEAEKAAVVQGTSQTPLVVPKYNPSSFFDELSSSSLESGSYSRGEERKKNSETFGAEGLQTNNRRRTNRGGGRGGGGAGGRGYNGGRGGRGDVKYSHATQQQPLQQQPRQGQQPPRQQPPPPRQQQQQPRQGQTTRIQQPRQAQQASRQRGRGGAAEQRPANQQQQRSQQQSQSNPEGFTSSNNKGRRRGNRGGNRKPRAAAGAKPQASSSAPRSSSNTFSILG